MKTDANHCLHLTVDIVLVIHGEAITRFGGSGALRSRELLESAIAAPQARFGGNSPFKNVIEIAASYLFYLCSNHPFVDGNKRVALGSCLVFLQLNGFTPLPDDEDWETLTLAIAAGALERNEVTAMLMKLVAAES